jgi:hypothetical protein
VFDTKTTTSTNEEEEEEKDNKDGNTTKEEKDCAMQDKKKTQATTTTTTEKASCRHIRVELSLKKSTFRRLQTCPASTAPSAPPTPQGARGTTLASQKKTEFYVIVVNIMDITYEFNERLRLIESIRDKREESTKCGEEGKSLKKRSVW